MSAPIARIFAPEDVESGDRAAVLEIALLICARDPLKYGASTVRRMPGSRAEHFGEGAEDI